MSRGRKPGFVMSDEHRSKISNSRILDKLLDHVEGKSEMSSTQINAARILLSKVLPDLSSVALTDADHSGPAKLEVTWIRD